MRRRLLAVALVAAAAASALAHDGGVLDLEPLEDLVLQRTGATSGRTHRAYTSLQHALDRASRNGLVSDLDKLARADRLCRTRLSDDEDLRVLVDAATLAADPYLSGEPDDVAAIVRLLERSRDRSRVTRIGDRAAEAHDRGHAALDTGTRVLEFRRAAAGFASAKRLGQRLVERQARRGAPGQPLPRGPSGSIDTYAGTGAMGAGHEGTTARTSEFIGPYDVSVEPATGLVLVVDSGNHKIRRIDADGRVRTLVGTGRLGDSVGPARESDLHHPSSVDHEPDTGALVVCGWHASRLVRLDPETLSTSYVAGSGFLDFSGDDGPAVDAEFRYPSNTVHLTDGTWFVADAENLRIRRVDGATGTITTYAGTGERGSTGDEGAASAATFDQPVGESEGPVGRIAVDPTERWLYVCDSASRRVRRIDLSDGSIHAFAGTGDDGWTGDGGDALAATFSMPVDVDCDGAGNVYVCDRGTSTVRRIDLATREITTVAGTGEPGYQGDRGAASAAQLDHPQGIHVDRVRGRVYVADSWNSVIRVIWE